MQDFMRRTGAAVAIMLAAAAAATGQDIADPTVTLEATAGDARIVGELIGFDDGIYTIRTGVGTLRIPAETVSCSGGACPRFGPPAITLSLGAPALGAALDGVLEDFAASVGARVAAAAPGDTGRRVALQEAEQTLAEIAMQQQRPDPEGAERADIALAVRPGGAPDGTVLGRDALVALVHPDNPLATLSPEQLAGLLDGSLADWSALGGPEGAVEIILPPEDTLAAAEIAALLPAAPDAARAPLDQIPAQVAGNPLALGVTPWSARGADARPLAVAGPCGMPAAPSDFSIASGQYPLTVAITLAAREGDLPPIGRELAGYMASAAARARLAAAGLPDPLPVVALPVGAQGDHLVRSIVAARGAEELGTLQALFGDLAGAEQLSTVYRFGSNAVRAEPDHAALTAALAARLATLDPERSEIFLHGYSDELETSRRRVGLSRSRAEYVRNLIAEAAPAFAPRLRTGGFEGLAPRGCNRDAGGRSLNRRVEVWLRSGG